MVTFYKTQDARHQAFWVLETDTDTQREIQRDSQKKNGSSSKQRKMSSLTKLLRCIFYLRIDADIYFHFFRLMNNDIYYVAEMENVC